MIRCFLSSSFVRPCSYQVVGAAISSRRTFGDSQGTGTAPDQMPYLDEAQAAKIKERFERMKNEPFTSTALSADAIEDIHDMRRQERLKETFFAFFQEIKSSDLWNDQKTKEEVEDLAKKIQANN